MPFEGNGVQIIQPIDPRKGPKYIELADDGMDSSMDKRIYNFTIGL